MVDIYNAFWRNKQQNQLMENWIIDRGYNLKQHFRNVGKEDKNDDNKKKRRYILKVSIPEFIQLIVTVKQWQE